MGDRAGTSGWASPHWAIGAVAAIVVLGLLAFSSLGPPSAGAADDCPVDPYGQPEDNDGDGIEDACDPDDDNDTVLDVDDNCPLEENTPQTDTDGDSSGDRCEVDDDDDDVLDDSDLCRILPGSAENGCPDVTREVVLKHSSLKNRFRGRITPLNGCATDQNVKIFRKRRVGRNKKIGSAMTRETGKFKLRMDVPPGNYFAKVGAVTVDDVGNCPKAKSKPIEAG